MLSFWAALTPDDVEAYVRGLILPGYLSHLTMEPLQFKRQTHNFDGRQPLILRYSGPGRLEEFPLDPVEHLPGLLRRLPEKLDLSKIVLNQNDALWNWENADETAPLSSPATDVSVESPSLRLFFLAAEPLFGQKAETRYPSEDAYVSVSRGEIFLSYRVVRDYLSARCRALLLPDSPVQSDSTEATAEFLAGTCRFRFGSLHGRLIPDDGELSEDIARFADLVKPLEHVSDYLDRETPKGPVRIDSDGIRLTLAEKR